VNTVHSQDLSMGALRRRGRRPWRAFAGDRKGATAIEFALIMPVFLTMMMGIFQVGLVFTAGQVLEDATTEFARLVRTGQAQGQKMTQAKFREEICERIAVFLSCSETNLLIDVQVLPSFGAVNLNWPIDDDGNFQDEGQFSPGGAGDIVVIRAFYQYPVWLPFLGETMSNLPNGKRVLAASAAFRNEPFGLSLGTGGAGS
jgi:Flp pilus assembly protein TadG